MKSIRLLTACLLITSVACSEDKFWFPTGMFAELPHERGELIDGFSGVNLPVTTSDETAQKFFQQGLAFLYCGDELEAQRAFREVITRDPDCAMGYWGIAQSCEIDWSRQTEYMWYASSRRDKVKTDLERDLIDAYTEFYGTTKKPEMVLVDSETGKRRAKPMVEVDSRVIDPRRDKLANRIFELTKKYPKQSELLPLLFSVRPRFKTAAAYMSDPPSHPMAARLIPWHRKAPLDWLDVAKQRDLAGVWNCVGIGYHTSRRAPFAALAFEAACRRDNAWLSKHDAMPYERHDYYTHTINLVASNPETGVRLVEAGFKVPKHPKGPFKGNDFFTIGRSSATPAAGSPTATQRRMVEKIGPLTWSPPPAPAFSLPRGKEKGLMSLTDLDGKPTLIVFYLGFGCIHCVEQLNELRPRYTDFKDAGIDIVAIGSDTADEVRAAILDAIEVDGPKTPFEILCDPKGDTFKDFHCWDEFTNEALHGTFLIDGKGHVRWRDISEEPFMDTDFLLKECKRLIAK